MPVNSDKATVMSKSNYKTLEEGVYKVKVEDVNLVENEITEYGVKDRFYFTFRVLEGEEKGSVIRYRTTTTFSTASNGKKSSALYNLACAVYGENLDTSKPLDVNTLTDGQLQVIMKVITKPDGKKWNNVDTVMRLKDKVIDDAVDQIDLSDVL